MESILFGILSPIQKCQKVSIDSPSDTEHDREYNPRSPRHSKQERQVNTRVARSSAFSGKFPLFGSFSAFFPQFRFFPLFENFLIHVRLIVFKKQFAKKESFFGKSMTITMQSLQNHWKEIDMENFLRRSRKDSTYQP